MQNCLDDVSTQQEIDDLKAIASKTSSVRDDKIRSAYTALWLARMYSEENPQEV